MNGSVSSPLASPTPHPNLTGKTKPGTKKCSEVGGAWGEPREEVGEGKGLGWAGAGGKGARVGLRIWKRAGVVVGTEGSWAPRHNGGWYQRGARVEHAPVASSLSEDVITPAKWRIQKQKRPSF